MRYIVILHTGNVSVLHFSFIFPTVFSGTGSKWIGAYKLVYIRLDLFYKSRQIILEGSK